MKRRAFIRSSGLLAAWACSNCSATTSAASQKVARMRGALLGGLIGDALGGPIEFRDIPASETGLTDARSWDDEQRLSTAILGELSETVPLLGYEVFRPEPAPYGPWKSNAPAGTLTDDSRHKIVLLRALAQAHKEQRELSAPDIARAFVAFEPRHHETSNPTPSSPSTAAAVASSREIPLQTESQNFTLAALNEEGFQEYRYAANWLLGERDLTKARPLERLWAGVNNCSGQMMFPPLAVKYAGDPELAYRATYALDFIDTPLARDMTAALVAGLAAALAPSQDLAAPVRRWPVLLDAMQSVDPYSYGKVPFAGRQLDKWMLRAREFADRADGRPKELYRLLETEGKPVYWWDAHFTLLVPLSILHLCEFNPLAAMHLTLDFGHDTDSYAQVLGCLIGAVHGESVFATRMVTAVQTRLQADFGEDVDNWLELLRS